MNGLRWADRVRTGSSAEVSSEQTVNLSKARGGNMTYLSWVNPVGRTKRVEATAELFRLSCCVFDDM